MYLYIKIRSIKEYILPLSHNKAAQERRCGSRVQTDCDSSATFTCSDDQRWDLNKHVNAQMYQHQVQQVIYTVVWSNGWRGSVFEYVTVWSWLQPKWLKQMVLNHVETGSDAVTGAVSWSGCQTDSEWLWQTQTASFKMAFFLWNMVLTHRRGVSANAVVTCYWNRHLHKMTVQPAKATSLWRPFIPNKTRATKQN